MYPARVKSEVYLAIARMNRPQQFDTSYPTCKPSSNDVNQSREPRTNQAPQIPMLPSQWLSEGNAGVNPFASTVVVISFPFGPTAGSFLNQSQIGRNVRPCVNGSPNNQGFNPFSTYSKFTAKIALICSFPQTNSSALG